MRIAGAATSANDIVPYFSSAVIHASGAAGTTVRSTPTGILPPWCFWKYSALAFFGQQPRPLIVTASPRSASQIRIGATPPMLTWMPSRTPVAIPAATPASIALPPASSICNPACADM